MNLWPQFCAWMCRHFGHSTREFEGSDYLVSVREDGTLDRRVHYRCPRCGDVEKRWKFGGDICSDDEQLEVDGR